MPLYVLLGPGGQLEQVATRDGLTPTEDGSNPRGWEERKVERFGDLSVERLGAKGWEPEVGALQAIKWDEVKKWRGELENGIAPTPVGPVQCDARSQLRILGVARRAERAAAAGRNFTEEFTLADNQVVRLDAAKAQALEEAVQEYLARLHATAQRLRSRIFSKSATAAMISALDFDAELKKH